MKTKLRKISIKNEQFIYIVSQDYDFIGNGRVELRVFLNGHKQTPLSIYFDTLPDAMFGNPFFTGISLENKLTKTGEIINVNQPSLVRKLTLYGQEIGWTGKNKIEGINGIIILQKWGFDTSAIAYWYIDYEAKKGFIKHYSMENIEDIT
jgi:hypothetical protein